MTAIRGTFVQDTVAFVASHYGWEAHQKVLSLLPESQCQAFRRPLREASWQSFEDLLAYMETAQRVLAPEDAGFFHRLGFYSGRYQRQEGGFAPMVSDPYTSMRMARVLWRVLYDAGRVELVRNGATEATVRIHDFPASRAHCERLRGSLEGLLGSDELPVQVQETACVLRGSVFCEMRVVWGGLGAGC